MSTTTNNAPSPTAEDAEPDTETEQGREPEADQATEVTEQEGGESDLPLDQIFELLKNERRRKVLQYLDEVDEEPVSIGELAEHIAAIENDTTVKAISSSQRKRVYVALYQCHLPKMDDCDVVEFDQNRGQISLSENAAQLDQFLESDEDERPWPHYYLGLSVGGAGLLGLSLAGASPFGVTPALILGALVVSVASCSLFHVHDTRSDESA